MGLGSLPEPQEGLVIRYSYLWHREHAQGREEGLKDRPCAIVAAAKNGQVLVVPITTRKPDAKTAASELPAAIGKQLGLGDRPSWIVVNEVNMFRWPGEDIRPATRDRWAFGQLPPKFAKNVVQDVREKLDRMRTVNRDQAAERVQPKDWSKKPDRQSLRKAPPIKRDRDRSR